MERKMKKMKRIKKTGKYFFLLLAFLLFPMAVFAAGSIDLNQEVKLNISYRDQNTLLAGAEFRLYQVATVDENGELTVTDSFRQYQVDIRGKNDEAWKTLASTLEGYVLRDKITPADSGKTGQNGELTFPTSSKKLEQGLYLVLGQRHEQGSYRYDAAPFMVMLPSQNISDNTGQYEVNVSPKFDSSKIPEKPDGKDPEESTTITRKVLKVWDDAGSESKRPKEVIIQLLKNGAVYDTVTLNQENNWRYSWSGLDDAYTWNVTEKEVTDYTVTIQREGSTFVVTNTRSGGSTEKPGQDTKLPQTGVLWWPVPLLVCGGLLFLIIGALGQRKKKDE